MGGHVVVAGYVTVPTNVGGTSVAEIDIPRGSVLPTDVPAEHVAVLLDRGHIAPVDDDPTEPAAADGVPDGSAAQVLEWTGADPDRAAAALAAEQAREKPRVGLVAELSKLVPQQ
jgi:N-methylhydantoinase B/oxoprolinase/acetone carboxylase alpha subunit